MIKTSPLPLTLALAGALTLPLLADDQDTGKTKPGSKRPPLTEEQRKIRKEITEKYDTNKNGRLEPDERKAMSPEDKDKLAKALLGPRAKKTDKPKDEAK